MEELSLTAIGLSLLAGVATFVSPCFLPMVPAYLGYLAGGATGAAQASGAGPTVADVHEHRLMVARAGWFVLGFTIVFVVMGAAASPIGSFARAHLDLANLIGGILLVGFGTFMLLEHRLPAGLLRQVGFTPAAGGAAGAGAAVVFGMVFAFAWTPCIGPTLGAALTLAATHDTVAAGATLLAVFSVGLGIPIVLLAVAADSARSTARWLARRASVLRTVGGVLMIVFGLLVASGWMSELTAELQRVTPGFLTP